MSDDAHLVVFHLHGGAEHQVCVEDLATAKALVNEWRAARDGGGHEGRAAEDIPGR